MSQIIEVKVPDIGDYAEVPVIDLFVKVGDSIKIDDAIVTLESDKATMDVPSTVAGVVTEVLIQLGSKVGEGALLIKVETGGAAAAPAPAAQAAAPAPVAAAPVAEAPVAAPAAAGGGIVGLNFATVFLREDGKRGTDMTLAPMLRHLDHLIAHLGEDHVGLGSDFDGAAVPDGIKDVAGLPALIAAMRAHGYDDALVQKLAWGNWMAALRRVWGQ